MPNGVSQRVSLNPPYKETANLYRQKTVPPLFDTLKSLQTLCFSLYLCLAHLFALPSLKIKTDSFSISIRK